jgi:hypothetical protein
VCELQAIRAKLQRQVHDLWNACDVLAVEHDVHGQAHAQRPDSPCKNQLLGMGVSTGDGRATRAVRVLKAHLDGPYAGPRDALQSIECRSASAAQAARHERRVETQARRARRQVLEIVAQERLAPGQMQLQHAQLASFFERP